jgi:hypothetical protein
VNLRPSKASTASSLCLIAKASNDAAIASADAAAFLNLSVDLRKWHEGDELDEAKEPGAKKRVAHRPIEHLMPGATPQSSVAPKSSTHINPETA